MANANQVIVNGETILDLRSDTVTPETLQKGYTAHDKSGTKITGTLEASSLQSKSVTYTANGTATSTPDEGYDGLSSVDVTVDVSGGGGVETCALTTLVDWAPGVVHGTIYAYSGNTLITITSKGTYSINKNSLIYIDNASSKNEVTGLEKLFSGYGKSICNVTSDIATYKFTM